MMNDAIGINHLFGEKINEHKKFVFEGRNGVLVENNIQGLEVQGLRRENGESVGKRDVYSMEWFYPRSEKFCSTFGRFLQECGKRNNGEAVMLRLVRNNKERIKGVYKNVGNITKHPGVCL